MHVDKSNTDFIYQLEKSGISFEINSFDEYSFSENVRKVIVKTHVLTAVLIKLELPNYFSDIDKMLYVDSDTLFM